MPLISPLEAYQGNFERRHQENCPSFQCSRWMRLVIGTPVFMISSSSRRATFVVSSEKKFVSRQPMRSEGVGTPIFRAVASLARTKRDSRFLK